MKLKAMNKRIDETFEFVGKSDLKIESVVTEIKTQRDIQ